MIDLGEFGPGAGAAVPATDARSRRPRRIPARWPLALAVAALVLATLTTAGALSRLEPAFTLRVAASAVALDDVNAYVSTGSGPAAVVTAYRLSDGRPAWQRPLYGRGVVDVAAVPGSAAIVTGRCPDLADALTTVVDPETGRHRWLFAGVPVGAATGGRLALMLTADGSCRSDRYDRPPAHAATISAVAADSGRAVWSVLLDGADRLAVATGATGIDTVLVVHPDGRVAGYRSGTGAVSVTARFPQLARSGTALPPSLGTLPSPPDRAPPELSLVGEHLVLSEVDSASVRVQAYRADGGAAQWRRTLARVPAEDTGSGTVPLPAPVDAPAASPAPDPSGFRLAGCAPWLCLLDGAQVLAVAPETGSTIWRRELSQAGVEAGRLVGYDRAGRGGLRLVDARSGFDVLDLSGWRRVPLLPARPGPLLIGRPAAGATRFAVLDPATGTVRVLGSAGGTLDRCGQAALRLVCTDRAGAVRAWQTRA